MDLDPLQGAGVLLPLHATPHHIGGVGGAVESAAPGCSYRGRQAPTHPAPVPTPSMDSDHYQQMRTVVAAPRLARAIAIGSRFCARAAGMLERLGLAGVTPSAAVDRQLLEARAGGEASELDQAGLFLCLRCRVGHAAEQKILALVRHFGHRHQLDPIDLAATVRFPSALGHPSH